MDKKKKLLLIFVLALILRVIFIPFTLNLRVITDGSSYTVAAMSLANLKGLKDLISQEPYYSQMPGYPIFLIPMFINADIVKITNNMKGENLSNYAIYNWRAIAVFIYQAILQSLLVVLLISLLPHKFILPAGIICSIDPFNIMFAVNLFKESGLMIYLGLFVYFFLLIPKTEQRTYLASCLLLLASISLLGMCLITAPVMAIFPLFFVFFYYIFYKDKKVFYIILSYLFLGLYLLAIYSDTGAFILRKTSNKSLILESVLWDGDGRFSEYDISYKKDISPVLSEINSKYNTFEEKEDAYLKYAIDYTIKHPFIVLYRFFKLNFWFWMDYPGSELYIKTLPFNKIFDFLLRFYQVIIVVFSVYGVFIGLRSVELGNNIQKISVMILILYLYFAIFHLPFHPVPRYYMPIRIFMLVSFVFGIYNIEARGTEAQRHKV
ncbi:MAG: hypothetical protein AB1765_12400 [Candidatus Hydrogenedentota bacterium]